MIKELSALAAEVTKIRQLLNRNVGEIARGLICNIAMDESSIRRSISEITSLCHKVAQLISRVSVAKSEMMRAVPNGNTTEWVILEQGVFDLRNAISQWPKIEELIRQQIPQRFRILVEEPSDVIMSQMRQYDAVFDQLHEVFKPQIQSEKARHHGCFADITLPNSTFVAYAHAAYRTLLGMGINHPARFLDVGCGTGFKVMVAAKFFEECDGLEYDPDYMRAARNLFQQGNFDRCSAFQADGLTYEGYDDYDVIYFYRPMREDDQMQELEAQILKHARPKALIIAPYRAFETRYQDYGCARVHGWMYVTSSTTADAEILRKTSEMTGPFVGKIPTRGQSLWDPILASSAAKGFGF